MENASENRYVPLLVAASTGMRTIVHPVYRGRRWRRFILVSAPPRAFAERDITMLWKPLRELAGMIDTVRKQVGPMEPGADGAAPPLKRAA
jgi:hypothetical protein